MGKIRGFYQRYLGNRFLLRMMLIYSVIIIGIISVMALFILKNITAILKDQAVSHNMQVLETVDVYFYSQNESFKKIVNGIYSEPLGQDIQAVGLIERLFAQTSDFSGTVSASRILSEYMTDYGLPIDTDIIDILLINPEGEYLSSSRKTSAYSRSEYYRRISDYISQQEVGNINGKKTYLVPPGTVFPDMRSARIYMIYDYIRQPRNPSLSIGCIAAVYNPDAIKNVYNQFSPYLLGDILILTDQNSIIFDSSGRYDESLSEIAQLSGYSSGTYQVGDSIMNVVTNQEFGYRVVGLIPAADLSRNADRLNSFILVLTTFGIFLILICSYFNTKRLSERVKHINHTLMKMEKGDLAVRVEIPGSNDEIKQIANNLNHMSEKLSEYIQREYLAVLSRANAELKQRTAELYALQAQINPHFLYNTLEAIRMQALKSQDADAAEMIKILAKLFRSSAKGELAVTVHEELEYCRAYLSLLDIRYQGRLEVEYELDQRIQEFAIVKHLLQPLVENSVLHGVDMAHDENQIRIIGRLEGQTLVFIISDNGRGISLEQLNMIRERLAAPSREENGSIGIYNVQNRIKMIYGPEYGLEIEAHEGQGTMVTMTIKAFHREELLKHVQSFSGGR